MVRKTAWNAAEPERMRCAGAAAPDLARDNARSLGRETAGAGAPCHCRDVGAGLGSLLPDGARLGRTTDYGGGSGTYFGADPACIVIGRTAAAASEAARSRNRRRNRGPLAMGAGRRKPPLSPARLDDPGGGA